MISGIVEVSIQTTNSARYATVSATPMRSSVGSARRARLGADLTSRRSVRLRGLALAEHHAQHVLERRILDREVGGLERAEQVTDGIGNIALGDPHGDALTFAHED